LRARVVELYRRRPIHGADDPALVELQQAVAMLPEYDAIREHRAILERLRQLFGASVETKRGGVLRAVAPGEPATPPHQDQFFMKDARRVWTVWIPLSDCPLRLGPLAVLAGSHRDGILSHVSNQVADPDPNLWWSTASMTQGDVLAFDGCTIHRACPNLTRDQTRFSIDFRYSRVT
jgi:ectoine hydroxylase-related dioxygenase (phytanoyl-CoA dioxygenase family)